MSQRGAGSEPVLDSRIRFSTQMTTLFIPGFQTRSPVLILMDFRQRIYCCLNANMRHFYGAATGQRQLKYIQCWKDNEIKNPVVSKWIQTSCLEISICKCMIIYHDRTCSAKSNVSNLFYSKKRILCLMTVFIYIYINNVMLSLQNK